jgi:hypothetical protein
MHNNSFMRLMAFGAFAGLCLCADSGDAAKLGTADFIAACSEDPSVTDDPGFDESKVTPKAYCECVAAELEKNNLNQKDVDMLTKMHNEDISDADVESYPTLEQLMNTNESFEDRCRTSLGLPSDVGTDVEEIPEEDFLDDDEAPADGEAPADEGPAQDDGSPPE